MTRFLSYPLTLAPRLATFASTPVHLEMLRDSIRSLAFQQAIAAAVKPGMRVLDVGAGSGLLGLWALQAGAAHLDAIEATELGDVLAATFAANGVSDRTAVHVTRALSAKLDWPADVVIAELLGHFGIDEGIVQTCHDVKTRLAKPNARFIPARVDVVAWPVWVPDFETDLVGFWNEKPYGLDFGALAGLTRRGTYLTEEHHGQRLAAAERLSSHAMGDPLPNVWQRELSFVAEFKSDWNGFFLSFVADLGGGVTLEGWRAPNWKVVFLPAPKVTRLKKGDAVTLKVDLAADGTVRYSVSP